MVPESCFQIYLLHGLYLANSPRKHGQFILLVMFHNDILVSNQVDVSLWLLGRRDVASIEVDLPECFC